MSDTRDDLVVSIAESPTGSTKGEAVAPVSTTQRAKEWLSKPRNKWIAGGSLAALLLIPAVVIPAVVVPKQQSAAAEAQKNRLPDWGGYSSSGSKALYLDPLVRLLESTRHQLQKHTTQHTVL